MVELAYPQKIVQSSFSTHVTAFVLPPFAASEQFAYAHFSSNVISSLAAKGDKMLRNLRSGISDDTFFFALAILGALGIGSSCALALYAIANGYWPQVGPILGLGAAFTLLTHWSVGRIGRR